MLTKLHKKTMNCRGYMHPLSAIGEKFSTHAGTLKDPVIDMGCAYGVASIAALTKGAGKVIACDIEQQHLNLNSAVETSSVT